jgi:redox-sensitive bicupin YhaK (pirin superfamily)
MFPVLHEDKENPLELFQIWLNLPKADKFTEPYFKMLWNEDIPVLQEKDDAGKTTRIIVVCGKLGESIPPAPTPESWAAKPENEVAIWLIRMEAGAEWTLPSASADALRSLYYHKGSGIEVSGQDIPSYKAVDVRPDAEIRLRNGGEESHILLLQGKPIQERAVQYGPFVMNTEAEIQQAFDDYRRTGFGGWPWEDSAVVHDSGLGRFARNADGREEIK